MMASERFREFMLSAACTDSLTEASKFAALAQADALDRIAESLAELVTMAKDSACGHGTPTLFSPCVDCQRRADGY